MRRAIAIVTVAASVGLGPVITAETIAAASVGHGLENPVPLLMQRLVNLVAKDRVPPPVASRVYAYTAIATARAAVSREANARRLTSALVGFPELAEPDATVNPEVAAITAWASTARNLTTVPGSRLAIAELRDDQLARAQSRMPADRFRSSIEWGLRVSRAVRTWSDADGFAIAQTRGPTYVPPVGTGQWVPTPPAFQPAIQPYWGTLRQFLTSSTKCAVPAPLPYSTDPQSGYGREVRKVLKISRHLTRSQKAIARFWADDRGRTGTPAGHWVVITNLAIAGRRLHTRDAALLQAAVTTAVADSFIVDWRGKFTFNTMRPITAINDQRLAPHWSSYLTTPAFPEYPSGHATISWAAATVLEARIGRFGFRDAGLNAGGDVRAGFDIQPRRFASFAAAAEEATVSRFYAGIHFDATQRTSATIGRCLGHAATNETR